MMSYDYRYLQSQYPYDPIQLEKVCRISDTLERITQILLLKEHLSLYGGTALNFIHFPEIQRLSVDIDFNYRHQGEEKDWGEIRAAIDEYIKEILTSLGYKDTDIKIEASYPLSRFTIKYTNQQNTKDSFKIETGYIKRIPILNEDTYLDFKHIGKKTMFKVKTPKHEEIYANKIVTMLDRATPRDLYDVDTITKTHPNNEILRKCTIVESLLSLKQPITQLNPKKIIEKIPYDQRIRSVTSQRDQPDIQTIREKVSKYVNKLIADLTGDEKQCIKTFYNEQKHTIIYNDVYTTSVLP
jgi:predicted nucleotidyltransferase component of viral defense system